MIRAALMCMVASTAVAQDIERPDVHTILNGPRINLADALAHRLGVQMRDATLRDTLALACLSKARPAPKDNHFIPF